MRPLFIAVLVMILASPARAEMDVATFLKSYDEAKLGDRAYLEQILSATYNGMEWSNAYLLKDRDAPLFCAPPKFALTGPQLVAMLRQEFMAQPLLAKYPFGMALFKTLQDLLPCP